MRHELKFCNMVLDLLAILPLSNIAWSEYNIENAPITFWPHGYI